MDKLKGLTDPPAHAWLVVANHRLAERDYPKACNAFRKALASVPPEDQPETARGLASCYLAMKKRSLALKVANAALENFPDDTELKMVKASALLALHQTNQAAELLRELLDNAPDHQRARRLLASALKQSGLLEEAYAEVGKLLDGQTVAPESRALAANILAQMKREPEAWEVLNPALETAPKRPAFAGAFAVLARKTDRAPQAAEALRAIIEEQMAAGVPEHELADELMQLAQVLDAFGESAESMECILRAKSHTEDTSNHAGLAKLIESLCQTYSPEAAALMPVSTVANKTRPIFIVGLPRSGTSLLEQILGCHPEVFPCGELGFMGQIVKRIDREAREGKHGDAGFPGCFASMNPGELDALAEEYLRGVSGLRGMPEPLPPNITDKMPYNYLYCGIILQVFPEARIHYARRNPLDNLLSCFQQNFVSRFAFMVNLQDLGFLFAWHDRMMRQFQQSFPDRIREVRYERVVADTEGEVRGILDWLGLPWDEACLRYYESGRVVQTASWDQATRPIYPSSVGRYRKYLEAMKPTVATLGAKLAADHLSIRDGKVVPDPVVPEPLPDDYPHPLPWRDGGEATVQACEPTEITTD